MTTDTAFATALHERTALLEVRQRRTAADGVLLLTLADPSGRDLPAWTPGAHIDLVLPDLDLTRQYSLCGDPADRSEWQIGVLQQPDGRGGSRYVHEALQVGASVEVRGPRNNFPLLPAERYLFIAGGIGITPIRPMIAAVTADGRPWELLYGGRSRRSMAFLEDLAAYGDRVRVHPEDEAGLLPLATFLLDLTAELENPLAVALPDCLVYCCGPEPLLKAIEDWCSGWPPGILRTERFAARRDPSGQGDTGFDVVCNRSGLTLHVPAGRSILEVAEAAGIPALSVCREGVCGTCETVVVDGRPEHRDSLLTPAEREAGQTMMICVSRSSSAQLVLDL
ncbi:MAG TPA: PDR/VanB family oxidoreductase [Actinophytocola sp.]|uniref:PDR/VanB family oxidoreductase n=1 Tax=Actinophytocola sp. TaxID=1872138 RepID=UPI002DDD5A52|nr:PDR/VanB family oxidoreductase [Actinophytocola sp.]HEV2780892.1 PDR/VanB family oxidoreductase [Actinophytocola sp.]